MISDLQQLLSESEALPARQPQDSKSGSREKTDSAIGGEKRMSKAQRIRDYWEENPGARNKDVAEALRAFGVTAAHVSNAKAQLQGKLKKKKKKTRGETKTSKATNRGRPTAAPASAAASGKIDVELFKTAVDFVRRAGGMNEAMHILNLIRDIRSL